MMLTEEKIRIIDTYYQMVDSGQWAELCELFSDDIVYERDGTGAIVGNAALLHFLYCRAFDRSRPPSATHQHRDA